MEPKPIIFNRLKSRTTIGRLFTDGKSVSKYPLRLVHVGLSENGDFQMGVSVSKKYFKKAVDRNYFKRVLRELFRKHKSLLDGLEHPCAFLLFYQTKERLPFGEIDEKMKALLEKFAFSVKNGS